MIRLGLIMGLIVMAVAGDLFAQGGVNFRGGIGTMITDEASFTMDNGAHYGWRGAVFARIGASDSWYFDPGLSYEQYNLISSSEFNAFDQDTKFHFIKGYVNIGTFLIRTDGFKMRLSAGGQLSYLASLDDHPDYVLEDFNDATLGVNGLVGFDIWFLTLDVGYEHGLTAFFSEGSDATNRFWTLSAGFFF